MKADDGHQPAVEPREPACLGKYTDGRATERGLRTLAKEISNCGRRVSFGTEPSTAWRVRTASTHSDAHTITFSFGFLSRVIALFRQLSLTNAFGQYSQVRRLDAQVLAELRSRSEIVRSRIKEESVPVDSLINVAGCERIDKRTLAELISRPPADAKHRFDLQTLVTPALVFAFWHEVAHVVYGHVEWGRQLASRPVQIELETHASERAAREGESVGQIRKLHALEYVADEFAARRIAIDILQSANVEAGRYVLGPFWFDRAGFEHFGKQEGLPGERIEYNLEGYLYRLAYAIIGLTLQMQGFLEEPHTSRSQQHPNAEIRLSRICDVVMNQLNGGTDMMTYVGRMWEDSFGYAMHTLDLGLTACNASVRALDSYRDLMGGDFRRLEIQARLRAAHEQIDIIRIETRAFHDEPALAVLEPQQPRHRLLPGNRSSLIEMTIDVGPAMYQWPAPTPQAFTGDVAEAEMSRIDETLQAIEEFAAASSHQQRLAIIEKNRDVLLTEAADVALEMLVGEVAKRAGAQAHEVHHLEACRRMLELCRSHGVDAPRSIDNMPILSDFIGSGTWPGCRRLIEENRDQLLSDETDRAMSLLIAGAAGNGDLIAELEQHRRLLQRCRTVGVDRAFDEARAATGAIFYSRNVVDAAIEFVEAPTWDDSRNIILEHADLLLSQDADEAFEQLIESNRSSPQLVATLRDHQALLAECRRRGVRRAFKSRAKRTR